VLSGKFLPGAELLVGTTVALRPSDYPPYLTVEVLEGMQRWAGEAKRLGVGGAALALAWVFSVVGERRGTRMDSWASSWLGLLTDALLTASRRR